MKSSLAYHCRVSLSSAAVLLGTTEGELYHYYKNHPPDKLNLYEIELIQKNKLKAGSYDNMWFESAAATKEPLLLDNINVLTSKLILCLNPGDPEQLVDCFQLNMPNNLNLGSVLECLRIINYKFEPLTGQLSDFLDRLSTQEFFRLA